jgi:hypothetical protein
MAFWRPQGPLRLHGCSNDNIGGGRLWRPEIVLQKAQTSVVSLSLMEKFIGGVIDTGEQFIGGVIETGEQYNDTGDNIFPRCR